MLMALEVTSLGIFFYSDAEAEGLAVCSAWRLGTALRETAGEGV